MLIENIKQKDKNLFEIKFQEQILIVPTEIIIKYNLLNVKLIELTVFKKIKKDIVYFQELSKTLKYINKKYRSIFEIKLFFEKEKIINSQKILKHLIEKNYVNDLNFAEMYLNDRLNFSNDGPYKITEQLKNHQIDQEIIDDLFKKINSELFQEKLFKIINKKLKQNKKYPKIVLIKQILNHCLELGYEREMILEIIDNNYQDNEEIIINEVEKIKKMVSNKYKDNLEKHLIKKLLQKGFTYEEIKKVI